MQKNILEYFQIVIIMNHYFYIVKFRLVFKTAASSIATLKVQYSLLVKTLLLICWPSTCSYKQEPPLSGPSATEIPDLLHFPVWQREQLEHFYKIVWNSGISCTRVSKQCILFDPYSDTNSIL